MRKSKYSLLWRSSKDEDGNHINISGNPGDIIISRELPPYSILNKVTNQKELISGSKVFAKCRNIQEFYGFYMHSIDLKNWPRYQKYLDDYIIRNIGGQYLCCSEKVGRYGRPVLDIDIGLEDGMRDFLIQYPLVGRKPVSFYKDLANLLKDSMINIGYQNHADILMEANIEWQTFQEENWDYSLNFGDPICISDGTRENKISIHVTLPFVPYTFQPIKTDLCYDSTNYEKVQHENALQCFMIKLYSAINQLALERWPWVKQMKGQQLLDRSFLSKSHDLRFAGHRKFEHLRMENCDLDIVSRNNITHVISNINLLHVPENLHIHIPFCEIQEMLDQKEINSAIVVDVRDDDLEYVWEQLQIDIPDIESSFEGIYTKNDCGNLIFMLKPIGKPTCPICRRVHDNNTPHVENTKNGYVLTCWQYKRIYHSDKALRPIPIGPRHVSEEEKIRWNTKLKNDALKRYEPLYTRREDLEVHEIYEQEMDELPEIGDVYVCSAMGTGKTKGIYSQLEDTETSFIMLSNRIIQAKKYKLRLPNATLYSDLTVISERDNPISWRTVSQLIVQLESIHKASKPKYSIVILDEIETILRLIISDTNRNKEIKALNKLIQYITNADRVFVMDAFLKVETIRWIIHYRNQMPYNIFVNMFKQIDGRIISSEERVKNPKKLLIYSKEEQWLGDLYADTRRKVITIQSKHKASKIAEELRTVYGQNTLLITADTPDYIKYTDPHSEQWGWNKYDNIVHTSALSNSISFEREHFQVQYVYCVRGSNGPEDLVQMMGRIRNVEDSQVHMFINKCYIPNKPSVNIESDEPVPLSQFGRCKKFEPVTPEQMDRRMKHGISAFANQQDMPLLVEVWNTMDENIQQLFTRLHIDHSLGQRFLGEITIHILKEILGWNIEECYISERKGKFRSVTNKNEEGFKEFKKLVDENWDGKPNKGQSHYGTIHIYNKVWCKNKLPILNMIAMVRGGEEIGDEFITAGARAMRGLINKLFELGGQNFEECLRNREEVILKFNTKSKIDDVLYGFIQYYKLERYSRNKWDWLASFLSDQLLLTGRNIYAYHLDMTDWLWYHIKSQ